MCVGILAADPLRYIGLQAILEEHLEFEVVQLREGVLPKHRRPGAIVVDVGPRNDVAFAEAIERLRRLLPAVPVIVLARHDGPELLHRAVMAGAQGFLPETAEIDEIRACFQAVMEGTPWLPSERDQIRELAKVLEPPSEKLSTRFTPKEREVLSWLTQGRSNREIAATMRIDEATVKAHLGRMLRKANASNRVELTLRVLAQQG